MTKRLATALIFVAVLTAGLRADWKSELNSRLGRNPDYRAAWTFLLEESKKLEPEDKMTAGFILPFLASRLDDQGLVKDLVADYFETYQDNDPDFGFLDEYTLRDFLSFWAAWKRTYPLVYDISLLSYPRSPATGLPASVDIGLELLNEAYFRVSLGPYILEGGYWPKGFHILTIPLSDLFTRSDTYDFILDLKAGNLICRKPIRVRIDIANMAAAPATAPADVFSPPPSMPTKPIQEGEISVYIDGKLVLKSRKIAARPTPFTFPLGGPLMQGQKPYLPPPTTNNPMMSGVNIVDALALAYKAIKDLVAKRPPKPSAPSYQKVSVLSFAYSRTISGGQSVPARASLSLPLAKAVILKE
jgi:hypothetical protein